MRPTWNRLPPALWSPDQSESAFKWALKTHLFSTAQCQWDVFMIMAPDINIQTYLLTYLLHYLLTCITTKPVCCTKHYRNFFDKQIQFIHWKIERDLLFSCTVSWRTCCLQTWGLEQLTLLFIVITLLFQSSDSRFKLTRYLALTLHKTAQTIKFLKRHNTQAAKKL